MLSAPYKSQRKRRRRKKQTAATTITGIAVQSEDASAPQASDAIDDLKELASQEQRPLFRLNDTFLGQEADVEAAMLLKQFSEDTDVSKRKEHEVAFFTKNIGLADPVAVQAAIAAAANSEIEADVDVLPTPSTVRVSYPEEGPQFASSYLQVDDKPLVQPCQRTPIEFDQQLLFLPEMAVPHTTSSDDVEASATTHQRKRDPADEGLFVHQQPELVNRNHEMMINRLMEEQADHWLNSYGRKLAHLASFLADQRPFKSEGGRKIRSIVYPMTSVEASTAVYAIHDNVLKVCIRSLLFERHPMFSEEQLIAHNVEQLYEQYVARRHTDDVAGLRLKLDVLRKLITCKAPAHGDRDATKTSERRGDHSLHRNELRVLRNRLHREEKADRDLLQNLLQEWRALKEIREKQESQKTQLRLVIKTREVDAAQDEIDWEYRFNLELNEIYEEAMEFYHQERQVQRSIANVDGASGGDFEPIQKAHRPDMDDIRSQLLDIFANSVRSPGEQLIELELIKGGVAGDGQRAANIRSDIARYAVTLIIDDHEVGSVKSSRMDHSGRVYFNEIFTIRLVSKFPETINVLVSRWYSPFYSLFGQ